MHTTFRVHPALAVCRQGPCGQRQLVHLRQSDLDGACGQHCLLMALQILGLASRETIINIDQTRSRALKTLWQSSREHYFRGTHAAHITALTVPFARQLTVEEHFGHEGAQRACSTLADGGLAMLGIRYRYGGGHWLLAIGTEGQGDGQRYRPSRFLLIDPSYDPLPLTPWNGVLNIGNGRARSQRLASPDGDSLVYLESVLTLLPKQRGRA